MITTEYDSNGRQSKLIDQNAGTTSYTYNALGELASQTNASNKTTNMQYDISGRTISRNGAEGNTVYEYYPRNSSASTNQLKKVTGFTGNLEEYTYDGFGRMKTVKETVDITPHTTTFDYNVYGDLISTIYPSGFGINNAFDANGYPTTIKNAANTVTLFSNTGMNGRGQTTNYALGNGLSSVNTYEYGFPIKMETSENPRAKLTWITSSENNSDRFEIERSQDGKNWEQIGARDAVGQAIEKTSYDFTDAEPNEGENFYRLKMIDQDGSFAHNQIRTIRLTTRLAIYPNPANDRFKIKGIPYQNMQLINYTGKMVYESAQIQEKGFNISSFPAGIYLVKILTNAGETVVRKLVKN